MPRPIPPPPRWQTLQPWHRLSVSFVLLPVRFPVPFPVPLPAPFLVVLSCCRLKCRLMNWSGGDMCVWRGVWHVATARGGHSACLSLIFCT